MVVEMRNGVKPKSRSPVHCWKMDPAGENFILAIF